MTGSIRAYARHRKASGLPGGTPAGVRKARDTGRIRAAISSDGLVDFEQADALWNRNADPDAVSRRDSVSVTRVEPAPLAKPADDDTPQARFAWWKAESERCKAQAAELELQEQQKSLLRADEVAASQEQRAREVTEHMLNFAGRVSAEIAATLGCDERKLYAQLDRHMRRHLEEKSQAFAQDAA